MNSRRCAFGYEGCYEKHGQPPKVKGFQRLSEDELSAVVIAPIGKVYARPDRGLSCWAKDATHNQCGCIIVRSTGDGKLHACSCIRGDPVERYLEAMGTPGCCTQAESCDRHRGALRGRNWRTGELG